MGSWRKFLTVAAGVIAVAAGAAVGGNPALAAASPSTGTAVYSNGFNDAAGTAYPEWGGATNTQSPNGTQRFLGPWARGTQTLTLPVTVGQQVQLDFQLYILLSMDGNGGPDVWRLSVPGAGRLLNTTFANWAGGPQAYPGSYPGGGSNPPGTGSSSMNTLGYIFPGLSPAMDSIYDLSFTFVAKASPLVISFTGLQTQAWPDEGWGVDNVSVQELPGTIPGPPTGVSATAGPNSSASVSFTAPSTQPPAVSFEAWCTSSTGGTTRWAWAVASPAVVTRLTGASTYSCQVRAVNALGIGTASDPSAAFTTATPGVPAAPTAVTVTHSGGQPYSVAFTPPTVDGGSPITFYVASCLSSTGGKNNSGAAAGPPVPVTGLTAGQSYICRVHAVNANGPGATSRPSAPFTA